MVDKYHELEIRLFEEAAETGKDPKELQVSCLIRFLVLETGWADVFVESENEDDWGNLRSIMLRNLEMLILNLF